ncbi:SdpI family protein [Martelella limonii]|uniref:SdpI family protein n=1 Tax=Martelella limonii TaxID=1647649 RepID=UPI001580659B|nr:SdpI family protein [Martelella limonii]
MKKNSPISLMQLALLAGLAVVTLLGFIMIPATAAVPIHWGVNGTPDAFWPRNYALAVLPVIALAMLCLNLIAGRRRSAQNGRHVARAAITAALIICLAIQGGVVMTALGRNIDMLQLVALAEAVLMVLIGNALPKSQPNRYAGLRLPWTLADPLIWQATHRLAGKLMIVFAVVLVIVAFVVPAGPWLVAALVACVAVPMLAASVISYRWSRHPERSNG